MGENRLGFLFLLRCALILLGQLLEGQIRSILSRHLYKDSKIQLLITDANGETNMTDFVIMVLFLRKLPNSKSCIGPPGKD